MATLIHPAEAGSCRCHGNRLFGRGGPSEFGSRGAQKRFKYNLLEMREGEGRGREGRGGGVPGSVAPTPSPTLVSSALGVPSPPHSDGERTTERRPCPHHVPSLRIGAGSPRTPASPICPAQVLALPLHLLQLPLPPPSPALLSFYIYPTPSPVGKIWGNPGRTFTIVAEWDNSSYPRPRRKKIFGGF